MHQEEVEQTLVLIKPDALKNSVTGFLLSLLSEFHTGSRFVAAKIVQVSRMLAEQHYAVHLPAGPISGLKEEPQAMRRDVSSEYEP